MDNPLISVILPTYNGKHFLEAALASVYGQGYTPLDVIVADDGSTDGTEQVAQQWEGVRFAALPHRGRPAFGRNVGIQLAQGDFLAFLDQDDVWADGALAQQLAAFQSEPALQVVSGRTCRVEQNAGGEWDHEGKVLTTLFVSATLFRREVFAQVGLFDETLGFFGDDTDWFVRAREASVRTKMLEQVTLFWRIHAHNLSHRNLRDHAQGIDRPMIEVVRKMLERKRARGEN